MKKPTAYDILLVEPDAMLARTYKRALEQAGFMVLHTGSAQEAITALDTQVPKLIIIELQLRSHNGVELLYELRSYPDLKGVPVIVLTFVPESTVITGRTRRQFNIAEYLYKPHTPLEKLITATQEAILP